MPRDIPELRNEIEKRRTFAIISHPDAGKTTLTEKLLLYSGMVRTAGMVRGRKGAKATSSDWMALEQERGISITASAMQFPYKNCLVNVLDTPGHQDFSEDTYRTLAAADFAVMVIDAAKGVEEQTKKLFAACRLRKLPILTFINKMDLPSREPLELLQEVEEVLGIGSTPMNWPIGYGREFRGVADVRSRAVTLFTKSEAGGSLKAEATVISGAEIAASGKLSAEDLRQLEDDLDLVTSAGNPFSEQAFLAGEQTPVFFASAITNFGVEPFFDAMVTLAPAPRSYVVDVVGDGERSLPPSEAFFSGFIFKIQANMNPKHRDCMAFIRVCSGCFEREMVVHHHRLDKDLRVARSFSMVARDRDTVDRAYPGDIVGLINTGDFAIGDTLSTAPNADFTFKHMPQFPPEVVGTIRAKDVMRLKAFDKGMKQLTDEGAIQLLKPFDNPMGSPLVAAVGRLQFDVLQFRLKDEYGVETVLDLLPYRMGYYLKGDPKNFRKTSDSAVAVDRFGRIVVLMSAEWQRRFISESNPEHSLEPFVPGLA